MGCAGGEDLAGGEVATGSGLRVKSPSSLLGGVLKGDIRGPSEGLRASGRRMLAADRATTFGLDGILGFSARFTGGGGAFSFSSCVTTPLRVSSSAFIVSERSALGGRGTGVEDRLEC